MDKSEVIRVRVSAVTLVRVRAKTELSGEGLSGYVRRLIMLDLGGSFVPSSPDGIVEHKKYWTVSDKVHDSSKEIILNVPSDAEKKLEPTVEDVTVKGVLLEGSDREKALAKFEVLSNAKDAIKKITGWKDKLNLKTIRNDKEN